MMIEGRNELAEAKWAPGGLPWWLRQWSICLQCGRAVFNPWVRKIPWRRKWQPTPVLLPGKSHGRRSLIGCTPWGCWESDTTEQLHFHFSLSCIGEGNSNPLQCSCLENPRDGGAWWAAVYGIKESDTTEATSQQQQQWLYRLHEIWRRQCLEWRRWVSSWLLQCQVLTGICSLHFCPSLFLQFCWFCKLSW